MKISLNLNKISTLKEQVNQAIKDINLFTESLESKINEVLKRLAEYGCEIAQLDYDNTYMDETYAYPEKVSVKIGEFTTDSGSVGYKITATGKNVVFLEFGTGIEATHPLGNEFGFVNKSWSVEHANQLTTKGYWFYLKRKYESTPATETMYITGKELEDSVERIVKDVFRK